jgi:hypothetical protein
MRRHVRISLVALVAAAGLALAGPTAAASAETSGAESFQGLLISSSRTLRGYLSIMESMPRDRGSKQAWSTKEWGSRDLDRPEGWGCM